MQLLLLLLHVNMYLCACVYVFVHVWLLRQTLWLHSEEEGHASGGAKERHS